MSSNPSLPIVGRLAPSPTGGLHVGHARTFLIAWLAARSRGGRIILRIEDIDTSRVRPGATETAIADLEWLGLDWDDGPYVQSQRIAAYGDALERLKRKELVYPCVCTRADIERAASAPHAEDEGPTYPGTCARRSASEAEILGDRPFAWRFRVSEGCVAWNDLFRGPMSLDPARIGGDFLVARSPFVPSYQLAVVVDDAAMGITQVIRGADLIPSTPRQILLDRALGGAGREYGHVPLVIGPDGRRLAKRDGSIKLATLRDRGVDPRRLIGWIARSSGWTDREEPSRPADWVDRFDPTTIPAEPCPFDPSEWVT
jgi:glutamyl-tRNA synthetase